MGSVSTPRRRRIWAAALCTACAAGPAHAQFSFTEQARRVFARATAANVSGPGTSAEQQFVAPDFGSFNATALASVVGGVGALGDARAQQISSLNPGVISAIGLTRVGAKMGSSSTFGDGRATWEFIVDFTVAAPTWVHVDAAMYMTQLVGTSLGLSNASLAIERTTPTGPVLLLAGQMSATSAPYAFSGPLFLEAGGHMVTLRADSYKSDVSHVYSQAQTDLAVTITVVPAPAAGLALVSGLVCGVRRRRP